MTGLRFGQPAPDFTLPSTSGADITLSALRGQDVVGMLENREDEGTGWSSSIRAARASSASSRPHERRRMTASAR